MMMMMINVSLAIGGDPFELSSSGGRIKLVRRLDTRLYNLTVSVSNGIRSIYRQVSSTYDSRAISPQPRGKIVQLHFFFTLMTAGRALRSIAQRASCEFVVSGKSLTRSHGN